MSEVEEEPRVLFWGHIWVTPADAARLNMDAMVHGNCYAKVTKKENGRIEATRIEPLAVRPSER